MTVEIGQKIKEVFDQQNIKLTDFADELGTVRQNVYRIFKKKTPRHWAVVKNFPGFES